MARGLAPIVVMLVVALASAPVYAAPTAQGRARLPPNSKDRRTGIGLSLGDPMGLTLKHFFTERHALQADLGWLPLHHGAGGLSLDYLFHSRVIGDNPDVDAVGYIGGGVGFGLWGRTTVGGYDGPHVGGAAADDPVHFGLMLRLPMLGLAFHWNTVPMDTCLEGGWTPFVVEAKDTRFGPAHVNVAIKARYYF